MTVAFCIKNGYFCLFNLISILLRHLPFTFIWVWKILQTCFACVRKGFWGKKSDKSIFLCGKLAKVSITSVWMCTYPWVKLLLSALSFITSLLVWSNKTSHKTSNVICPCHVFGWNYLKTACLCVYVCKFVEELSFLCCSFSACV